MLYREGWKPTSLKAGDQVTVTGSRWRRTRAGSRGTRTWFKLPDGRCVFAGSSGPGGAATDNCTLGTALRCVEPSGWRPCALVATVPLGVAAQWQGYPTPRIPRTADGKANLVCARAEDRGRPAGPERHLAGHPRGLRFGVRRSARGASRIPFSPEGRCAGLRGTPQKTNSRTTRARAACRRDSPFARCCGRRSRSCRMPSV